MKRLDAIADKDAPGHTLYSLLAPQAAKQPNAGHSSDNFEFQPFAARFLQRAAEASGKELACPRVGT
jgi:hypothetical protein